MDLNCAVCGRLYTNLPEGVKQPIYCGDCKPGTPKQVANIKTVDCIHRGKVIGRLDCRCGGAPKVHYCRQLQEPCMEHAASKPWASIKVLPNEGWQITAMPMVCATCPLRTEKA